MFGEDPKQFQSDEFFGLFSAFLVSFAVRKLYLTTRSSTLNPFPPLRKYQRLNY